MEGTSMLGISTCLLILTIFGIRADSFNLALTMLILAFFCQGFETSGSSINSIELAPSYSGFLFGAMNCISALPGISYFSLFNVII